MAGIELTEDRKEQVGHTGSADVVVGIAGPVAADELQARAAKVLEDLGSGASSLRFVFTWPGSSAAPASSGGSGLSLLPFSPPAHGAGELWSGISAHQRAILALAGSLSARACIVLGSDLAALEAHAIQLLSYAVLERECGLAVPIYPAGKYDGLINSGILSPLNRALYGKRIRYPLSFDFAASGAMASRLAAGLANDHSTNPLLWPVTIAATQSQSPIGQVHIDVHHQIATGGLELSAVLGQIVGSLFQEMELLAPHWQKIRGSQPTPVWGRAPSEQPDGQAIDTQSMLDSFLLGSRNLEEVWKLVLPPNTMLEIRRLTRLAPDKFHMPDELWAGIVYDFALAYRLRTISRVHLVGALTPLYLGWVASYINEVSTLSSSGAEQRLEQLARTWEEKKPYLLSRWRWPDRFNP